MDVKAVVTLHPTSGLPEDEYVNTFHFRKATDFDSDDELAVRSALGYFYGNAFTAGSSISNYIGACVSRSAVPTVALYDDDAGGSPLFPETALVSWDDPTSSNGLPQEVAACLSFHADLTGYPEDTPAGAPGPTGNVHQRARRRGRIYIGPLTVVALGSGANPRLDSTFQEVLTLAGASLLDHEDLVAAGIEWCVRSAVEGVSRPVVGGWVDNSFDTQRRRGLKPSSRVLFP